MHDPKKIRALLDRTAAVLTEDKADHAAVAALRDEAAEAAEAAEARAREAREAALDPRKPLAEADKLRRESDEAAFLAERTRRAAGELDHKAAALAEAEAVAAELREYQEAKAEHDRCAERIKAEFPSVVAILMPLIADIVAVTRRVVTVNRKLPEGMPPLQGPEGVARGFNDCAGAIYPPENTPTRIVNMLIPTFPARSYYAWPMDKGRVLSAHDVDGFDPHRDWPLAGDVAKAVALMGEMTAPRMLSIQDVEDARRAQHEASLAAAAKAAAEPRHVQVPASPWPQPAGRDVAMTGDKFAAE